MLSTSLLLVLLGAIFLLGLVLVPLGLPGLWLMVLGIIGYGWLTDWQTFGPVLIGGSVVLALVGEILESWLGFRYAKQYGGSSRAGWGALLGGIVGAIIGLPIPVLGSIIAGFIGSFVGGALFEFSRARSADVAMRAGWGAVVGRAAAAAVKIALGVIIAVWALVAVLRG